MYWNYRMLSTHDGEEFHLIEVYYDENDDTIEAWCEAGSPSGCDVDDLGGALALMMLALNRPALTLADLPSDNDVEVTP